MTPREVSSSRLRQAVASSGEAQRLHWAAQFTAVPRVLDRGTDTTDAWLVTTGLPEDSAVSDLWLADPRTAVTAIGDGLRAMHDALPVDPARSHGLPKTGSPAPGACTRRAAWTRRGGIPCTRD